MSGLPSLEEICKFGMTLADDGLHPFNPEDETWNESYFFDWYNEDGTQAGHCRIGLFTGQDRLWLWLFLYDGANWAAIEEPRLPLTAFDTNTLSFDKSGLSFSLELKQPLQQIRLKVQGTGRIISGPLNGHIVPVAVDVDATGTSAAHSIGQNTLKGHADESYSTSRFEQAISAKVTQRIADQETTYDARGERDHSWGPRQWNITWHFLVGNGDAMRFQSTKVLLGGFEVKLGYVMAAETLNVKDVAYDLTYHDNEPTVSVEGTYQLTVEDGSVIAGRIEPISGVEIDLSHSLPSPSLYRRTLVRLHPDDGAAPMIGWMEINRMLD